MPSCFVYFLRESSFEIALEFRNYVRRLGRISSMLQYSSVGEHCVQGFHETIYIAAIGLRIILKREPVIVSHMNLVIKFEGLCCVKKEVGRR